jgi:hypothetical protein
VKTTIELPGELLREAKATAARQGKSLKELFSEALREHLGAAEEVAAGGERWRRVFGKAEPSAVAAVDAAIAEELERIEPESWA